LLDLLWGFGFMVIGWTVMEEEVEERLMMIGGGGGGGGFFKTLTMDD